MKVINYLLEGKRILFTIILFFAFCSIRAQVQTQVVGDSVHIHSNNTTGELILENSTKSVLGFLYNKGNGRTEFRRGIVKLSDSFYLVGNDTLKIRTGLANVFIKDGLTKDGDTLFLGNKMSGNGPHSFTANRHQFLNGNFYSIGGSQNNSDSFPVFRFYNNGNFTSNVSDEFTSASPYKNGIRYNARMGYLQVGVSSLVDTTISNRIGEYETSAIILNTDSRGDIKGQLQNAFIGAYNVRLPVGQAILSSMLTGGSFFLGGSLSHVIGGGVYHTISENVNGSLIMGNSQQIRKTDQNSGWLGAVNINNKPTYGCLTAGWNNSIGSMSQLTVGGFLINKSYSGTVLGNANVDFSSLSYISWDSIWNNTQQIQGGHPLFVIGNSASKGVSRSNAISILYNGRTQINTTGFINNLVEADVKPKAAFEVVSTNSGVLLPKLTSAQKDAIANADLYSGLLLFNTDLNAFQYYSGTTWKTLTDQDAPITNIALIDFPSTDSSKSSDRDVTVLGAADGDMVSIGVPNSSTAPNSNYTAWVSATNTVTIRFNNYSNVTLDPAQGSFKVKVIK